MLTPDDDRAVLEALRDELFVAHVANLVRAQSTEVEIYRPSDTTAVFESHGMHRVPAPRYVEPTRVLDRHEPYRSRLRWALPIAGTLAAVGFGVLVVVFVVIPMLTALAVVLVEIVKAVLAVAAVIVIIVLLAAMGGGRGGGTFSGTFHGRMH